jgi:hypothetical protein
VRTTIDIPDDLLAEAKRIAAESKRPLRAVIEDALREALSRRPRASRAVPVCLPTFQGGGLQPGVDLDDPAALLDVMEAGVDSPPTATTPASSAFAGDTRWPDRSRQTHGALLNAKRLLKKVQMQGGKRKAE